MCFFPYSGAEVQFAITDCVALVREVADHQVRIITPFSVRWLIDWPC